MKGVLEMSIVKSKNKKTGVTYVYESESYWDKEKQQPRAHRRLIGKLDEETGDIIPTGRSGRRDANGEIKAIEEVLSDTIKDLKEEVFNQKVLIEKLTAENDALKKKNEKIIKAFRDTLKKFDD